jgi:hypothetical protein
MPETSVLCWQAYSVQLQRSRDSLWGLPAPEDPALAIILERLRLCVPECAEERFVFADINAETVSDRTCTLCMVTLTC